MMYLLPIGAFLRNVEKKYLKPSCLTFPFSDTMAALVMAALMVFVKSLIGFMPNEAGMDANIALLGEGVIPADLKNALNDRFSVQVSPYDDYPITRFADECKKLCDKLGEKG